MVVMAIIAILATAGLSAYTGYIKKARDTTRTEIARAIVTLVTTYTAEHNGVAPTASELTTLLTSFGIAWIVTPQPNNLLISMRNGLDNVVGISNVYALKDPLQGKTACLTKDGTIGETCRFVYVVYIDNTYALSYGIEHMTNTKTNFYYMDDNIPRAGIFVWNVSYIGVPQNITTKKPDIGNTFPARRENAVRIDEFPQVLFADSDACTTDGQCQSDFCKQGYCSSGGNTWDPCDVSDECRVSCNGNEGMCY